MRWQGLALSEKRLFPAILSTPAVVAELADALDSGSSGVIPVEVRSLSTAIQTRRSPTRASGLVICRWGALTCADVGSHALACVGVRWRALTHAWLLVLSEALIPANCAVVGFPVLECFRGVVLTPYTEVGSGFGF